MSGREQWEALIVETAKWRADRPLKVSGYGGEIVLTDYDMANLDETLLNDFRSRFGFNVPDIQTVDHPIANFYVLFYTEHQAEFVREVLSMAEVISSGVRELLIDQIFRYFVFASPRRDEAIRFGQLVVAVSVYRNTFDDNSMDFLRKNLPVTNRRLFRANVEPGVVERDPRDEGGELVYSDKFKFPVPRRVVELSQTPPRVGSEYDTDPGVYLNPPPFSTNVYSPRRMFLLHVLHVLAVYGPESTEPLYLYYPSQRYLDNVRALVPPFVRVITDLAERRGSFPMIAVHPLLETDSEWAAQREFLDRVVGSGDVLAVSLVFRVPGPLFQSGDGTFIFPDGEQMNVAWGNGRDGMLVWTAGRPRERTYEADRVETARRFHEYGRRPLIPHERETIGAMDDPQGLLPREFDSEMERFILKALLDKYPSGEKMWVELTDLEEDGMLRDILAPPRGLLVEDVEDVGELFQKLSRIVDLKTKSNPVVSARIWRSGIVSTVNRTPTVYTDCLEYVFGRTLEETRATLARHDEFVRNEGDLIRTIDASGIFPNTSPEAAFAMIRDMAPDVGLLIRTEPPRVEFHDTAFFKGRAARQSISIVQLGDGLGNLYGALEKRGVTIASILYRGSVPVDRVWGMAVSAPRPRIEAIADLMQIESLLPKGGAFIVYATPSRSTADETILGGFLRKSPMFLGTMYVESGGPPRFESSSAPRSPVEALYSSMTEELVRTATEMRDVLVLRGERDDIDLTAITFPRTLQRLHVVVSNGMAAVRARLQMARNPSISRRVMQEVFIQTISGEKNEFVSPRTGQRYTDILCSAFVIGSLLYDDRAVTTFLRSLEPSLTKGGSVRALTLSRREVDDLFAESEAINDTMQAVRRLEPYGVFLSCSSFDRNTDVLPFKFNGGQMYARYPADVEGLDVRRTSEELRIPFDVFVYRSTRAREQDGGMTDVYGGAAVDVGKRVREINNLAKRALIEKVPSKERVLDLASGHGQDIAKWFAYAPDVEIFAGYDVSEDAVREANRRLATARSRPRTSAFYLGDVFEGNGWVHEARQLTRGKGFTAVSMQLAIHYAFRSEDTVRSLFGNISAASSRGATLILSTVDREALASVLRSHRDLREGDDETRVAGEFFEISFPRRTREALLSGEVIPAGYSYDFLQFPSDPLSRLSTEYVVDGRHLEEIAREAGFEKRQEVAFADLVGDRRQELTDDELAMVSFYRGYVFEKTKNRGEAVLQTTEGRISEVAAEHRGTRALVAAATHARVGDSETPLVFDPYDLPVFLSFGNHPTIQSITMVTFDATEIRPVFAALARKTALDERHLIYLNKRGGGVHDRVYLSPRRGGEVMRPGWLQDIRSQVAPGGDIVGVYLDGKALDRLTGGPLQDTFSNFSFHAELDRTAGTYELDFSGPTPIVDIEELRSLCRQSGFELVESAPLDISRAEGAAPTSSQETFFGLLRVYRLRRVADEGPSAMAELEAAMAELEVVGGAAEPDSVDKFILYPHIKKAPGEAAGEKLSAEGRQRYRELGRDRSWRAILADGFYDERFPIRMDTGELFRTVTDAILYYKCQFADGPEGYEALNLNSGAAYPEDTKPFAKALLGKKGKEWKDQLPVWTEKLYRAKFTNNQDRGEALHTPLQTLLLTGDAQLFKDAKTRNSQLEAVRSQLRTIYEGV